MNTRLDILDTGSLCYAQAVNAPVSHIRTKHKSSKHKSDSLFTPHVVLEEDRVKMTKNEPGGLVN